jgi:hypothetical protein
MIGKQNVVNSATDEKPIFDIKFRKYIDNNKLEVYVIRDNENDKEYIMVKSKDDIAITPRVQKEIEKTEQDYAQENIVN